MDKNVSVKLKVREISNCDHKELAYVLRAIKAVLWIGLGTEFRSEKIPRNRLGMVSVIPRKKAVIPRHSEFRGRANSEARNGTERNGIPRKY
jgi:hypothetical protein